jgi:hypothetical protein
VQHEAGLSTQAVAQYANNSMYECVWRLMGISGAFLNMCVVPLGTGTGSSYQA